MNAPSISDLIARVDCCRMKRQLFHLCRDPLPCRMANYTLPGHRKCTLDEADDYIEAQLASLGFRVEKESVQVQAFRRDESKPKAQQYAPPLPEDPWYKVWNVHATKTGVTYPDEIIVIVAHKDSQSWLVTPGAGDNGAGVVGALEVARVLSAVPCARSLQWLFCNEEFSRPVTSLAFAAQAKQRGNKLVAVLNLDGIGGKSRPDRDAGRKTQVTVYTRPEGERLARFIGGVNDRCSIGLAHRIAQKPGPEDDDGAFVSAGYPASVMMIGSWPYADPNYHRETDAPEAVDIENVVMTTRLALASVRLLAESRLICWDDERP